ncbi:MAG TPA: hypothetical protein VEQ58_16555, partial [Polyangiaceae bacterium]|nr:hypothetical protein [Polyangiaceae bacterium]
MTEQGLLRPGWGRPELVAALSQCVAEWEGVLRGASLAKNQAFYGLVGRSRQLEAPSRSVGFGGIGYHLSELSRIAESASVAAAREQLGVVRDLLSSARASLTPDERVRADAAVSGPPSLQPPPLLSSHLKAEGPAPPAHFASAPPGPGMAPPRLLTMMGAKSAPPPPPAVFSSAPPAAGERPMPKSPVPMAPPPAPSAPPPAAPPAAPGGFAPMPAAPARPGQPNLMVRSVLGLRAFGQKNKTPPPAAGASLPPPAGNPSDPPPLLGLSRRSSS